MKLCVIPARGGSKRIPRKNIKEFCGKPMIAYSIQAAKDSGCFDRVIVSTDDQEIADVAKSYGADVPFMRPRELSNDYAGTIPVIKHAIEWFEVHGEVFSEVCCLYATAPFIGSKTIKKSYDKLISTGSDYCITVASFSYPIHRALKINEFQKIEMIFPENLDSRSQDLEEVYHDAGQLYWGKSCNFTSMMRPLTSITTPYILPRHLVQDIDDYEDWIKAEFMFKSLSNLNAIS